MCLILYGENFILCNSLKFFPSRVDILDIYALKMTTNTVKPVLRGHLWEGQKVAASDRKPLNTGSLHYILVQGTQTWLLLKTSGSLMEVTT